jgi:kynureninase
MDSAPLDPARLRPLYGRFLEADRVLLTGHSHQAWPDVAREGLLASFDDAAELVDDKWERAMAASDAVRRGVADRIGGDVADIALGASTHELVARFLSALDVRRRPKLVTTTGEFHSLDRQMRRLAEAGLEVVFVDARPVATLAGRLAAAVDERTAALLVSTVLFETAERVPGLGDAIEAAHRAGAEVLLDGYHAFNVVPERVADIGPDPVFYVAGGYKYAQWGEGCCFMRVPPATALRPVYTGWFADFSHLAEPRDGAVRYGDRGADLFAGSTYDPASHYRAAAVIELFRREHLGVERLRALSLRQTRRLIDGLDGLDLATPREDALRAGFVAVRVPRASEVVAALRADGIFTDARGDLLRLGPAPYVTDDEIDRALAALRSLLGR